MTNTPVKTPKKPVKKAPSLEKIVNGVKKIIDTFSNLIFAIIPSFKPKDKEVVMFLQTQGIETPERFKILIEKIKLIKSGNEEMLLFFLNDVAEARIKRREYYSNEIQVHNYSLSDIRKKVVLHATEELENQIKAIKQRNKFKYGIIIGYFHTRIELKNIDLNRKLEELINYYLSNSNLELEELIIKEIKNDYNRELEMYNRCYERLKELYIVKYYNVFHEFEESKTFNYDKLS